MSTRASLGVRFALLHFGSRTVSFFVLPIARRGSPASVRPTRHLRTRLSLPCMRWSQYLRRIRVLDYRRYRLIDLYPRSTERCFCGLCVQFMVPGGLLGVKELSASANRRVQING